MTIFPANQIGLGSITEAEFTKWLQTNEKVSSIKAGHINRKSLFAFSCEGVDSLASSIHAYAYQVSNLSLCFTQGTLELGSVPITVTFDERFIRPLFGNDLMSLLIAKIDSDNMRLELELNKMMREDNHKEL